METEQEYEDLDLYGNREDAIEVRFPFRIKKLKMLLL